MRRRKPSDFDPEILAKLEKIWFDKYRNATGAFYMKDGKTIGQLKTLYKLLKKDLGRVQLVVDKFFLSPASSRSLGLLLHMLPRLTEGTEIDTNALEGLDVYSAPDDESPAPERPGTEAPHQTDREPEQPQEVDGLPGEDEGVHEAERDSGSGRPPWDW